MSGKYVESGTPGNWHMALCQYQFWDTKFVSLLCRIQHRVLTN
ncbi:hypothetical protein M6B38_386735 [Iris pallida]|uniref:Uncharacterized protein n=1 Tax=Iris pallida TaxID=29817 RepID=A0AAX6G224_IRIPA|nr:hypothetical protein M6B38_386735 [Iris pallida]